MGLVGKEGIPLQPYHCDSLCPLHHQCSCGCGGGGGEEAPWGRHCIGIRTMKVTKKLMMDSNDNLGRVCDDDGKYSEDDSYDDSDETLKLDEGVLHMREEGDGEDVNDLQDSMGSSAVQGASAEVIDVIKLIKVSWTLC